MSQPLLQSIYSGLLLGSIYALMGLGLTLIYGSMRMLNLSHGTLFMWGGYIAWMIIYYLNMPLVVGMIVAFFIMAGVGYMIFPTIIKPLFKSPGWDMTAIIATLGLSIVLENAALLIFGPRRKDIPPIIPGQIRLESIVITYHEIIVGAVVIATLIGMATFLKRSRHGLAILAVAQNQEASNLMGVNVYRTFALVLAVCSGLAAVGGGLLSSFYFLSPTVGGIPQLKALLIIIFGGLGSVKGTVYAAYIVGLIEMLVSLYIGAKWSLPVLFLVMIIVLIVRPSGLFGLGEEVRL